MVYLVEIKIMMDKVYIKKNENLQKGSGERFILSLQIIILLNK